MLDMKAVKYRHRVVFSKDANQSIKSNQIKSNQIKSNQSICAYTCMFISIYIYIHVYTCVYIHIYRAKEAFSQIGVAILAHGKAGGFGTGGPWTPALVFWINVCMYIYIYIHIYIYIMYTL